LKVSDLPVFFAHVPVDGNESNAGNDQCHHAAQAGARTGRCDAHRTTDIP
jgi:hypothetical protein